MSEPRELTEQEIDDFERRVLWWANDSASEDADVARSLCHMARRGARAATLQRRNLSALAALQRILDVCDAVEPRARGE